MRFRLPKEYEKSLLLMLQFREASWDAVISTLETIRPTLIAGDEFAKKLAENDDVSVSRSEAVAMMQAVFSLYMLYLNYGAPAEQFVEELAGDIVETLDEHEVDVSLFKVKFPHILRCEETLGVAVKGVSLLYDEEKVLSSAKIVSDIRPIFLSDPTQDPPSVLIVHSLRLQFLENNRESEIYMALDASDLKELKNVIDRAMAKEKTLTSLLAKASVARLGGQS